ncbi:septum formation initiator family protein [Facklamia sp. DSM 111018]|uniref:Septum formation initiator family protein n=1 Tax=Facklamia lactis TaxID=2749967 RepID=A0ABS0LQP7_9LACT|nr:septum formation initiator family protein [Facklamia lactis]MBG9980674.1 septum formation initiator family protein [Facklamia lactis]MBG9986488.1 septum formation initiator family protein [Facklamia lactis]
MIKNQRVSITDQRNRKVLPFQQSEENRGNSNQLPTGYQTNVTHHGAFRLVLTVLGLLIMGLVAYPLFKTIDSTQSVKSQLVEAEKNYQLAQEYYETVKDEHERSQDPEYLAKIARRDYYYTDDGEIVFDIGEDGKAVDQEIFDNAEITE